MRIDSRSKVPEIIIVAFIVLLSSKVNAETDSPEALPTLSTFPGESVEADLQKFQGVHGLHEKGARELSRIDLAKN